MKPIMEVRQTNFELYTFKDIDDFSMTSVGDFHYDDYFDKNKLVLLKNKILENESNYNCIIGDLINENNVKSFDELLRFLEDISKYSKTLISFGNHEMMNIVNKKAVEQDPYEFIKLLQNLRNVILLNNSYFEENKIEFAGVMNSFSYYEKEKPEDFIEEVNQGLTKPFAKNNFNILLCHSPVNLLIAKEKVQILDKCDVILSAHNHNGLIPPALENKFQNKGLINHRKDILPEYSRGSFYLDGIKVIINGGVTKFGTYSKFKNFNKFYYMDIDHIRVRKI